METWNSDLFLSGVVWIGAPDLVDLDLLESGQPMNVLMFREGVGCSD